MLIILRFCLFLLRKSQRSRIQVFVSSITKQFVHRFWPIFVIMITDYRIFFANPKRQLKAMNEITAIEKFAHQSYESNIMLGLCQHLTVILKIQQNCQYHWQIVLQDSEVEGLLQLHSSGDLYFWCYCETRRLPSWNIYNDEWSLT